MLIIICFSNFISSRFGVVGVNLNKFNVFFSFRSMKLNIQSIYRRINVRLKYNVFGIGFTAEAQWRKKQCGFFCFCRCIFAEKFIYFVQLLVGWDLFISSVCCFCCIRCFAHFFHVSDRIKPRYEAKTKKNSCFQSLLGRQLVLRTHVKCFSRVVCDVGFFFLDWLSCFRFIFTDRFASRVSCMQFRCFQLTHKLARFAFLFVLICYISCWHSIT